METVGYIMGLQSLNMTEHACSGKLRTHTGIKIDLDESEKGRSREKDSNSPGRFLDAVQCPPTAEAPMQGGHVPSTPWGGSTPQELAHPATGNAGDQSSPTNWAGGTEGPDSSQPFRMG